MDEAYLENVFDVLRRMTAFQIANLGMAAFAVKSRGQKIEKHSAERKTIDTSLSGMQEILKLLKEIPDVDQAEVAIREEQLCALVSTLETV